MNNVSIKAGGSSWVGRPTDWGWNSNQIVDCSSKAMFRGHASIMDKLSVRSLRDRSQVDHRFGKDGNYMTATTYTNIASRILVVDDEPAINDIASTALRYQGHSVTQTGDGTSCLSLAQSSAFDLIVLDVMLPNLDGYEVCRRLRESGNFCPVLFLTASDAPEDRIKGFVTGGDDYLTKPFSVDELTLRVAAILRRSRTRDTDDQFHIGDLSLETKAQEVRRGGKLVKLSPTEFKLLHYLMVNAGTVVSKTQILVNVWDYDYAGSDNVVETYIGYLRRKIDDGQVPLIHTRRGAGYLLRAG